ncbi:hypothetical protein JH06_5475 [Blastocystis sp. subtype 4]|uniref:hypothetical protein n=1 Tax=Blastocystis sp. subtype 4 TaxID=944170 RepID=UPI000711BF1A|nr:hypothetical protein JH06_5475 [Blastocystis sp. subtype 4]KNB41853.1 hypothetical protein JH06_5475 [Blastocystis sp. subtype 4]|eukprot:XP_014525296.1 hypothetical protein JH06_5475 [Blastocystis sp. subtype 4]
MDWFPIDKYVSIASVSVCCVCIMMSIMQYDNSSLLALGFILLDVTLGLPFPCSSIVIQKFIEPHYQSLLWSLLALTSNLGAVISTSLVYYIRSIPKVFSILAKFGMGCTVVFYVFFPQTEHSKLDNAKKTNQSVGQPVARELFCLILSFIAQFLIYLTRRIISEWSSVYLQHLFPVTTDQSVTIFTYSSNLFEIFGIISLLLFGLFSFFL